MGRKNRLAGNSLPITLGFTEGLEKGSMLRALFINTGENGNLC